MSHKWSKFSGQGSPLILSWYLSTSLKNHKWSSIIQHNWQSSAGRIVEVEEGGKCYCLFRVMPQLTRSAEETVATEMAFRLPRSLGWKEDWMSCAATEVGNMPHFYSPDWSKYFHGLPIKLVWVGNVWSSLVCSSGWTEYWWYFRGVKARRERHAVSQYWGTPVKTYGDLGRCTAGGLVELHIRILKITVGCWAFCWFGVFFISINNYSLLSKVYDDWSHTGNDKKN